MTATRMARHRRAESGIQEAVRTIGHGSNFASTRVTVAPNIPISNGRATCQSNRDTGHAATEYRNEERAAENDRITRAETVV